MIHPTFALSLVSLLPVFALRAQQVPATSSPAAPVAASKSPVAAADAVLAGWLTAECNGEVVLAQIAVRRAQSSGVEQFAKLLIAEHEKLEGELRPFTSAAEPKGDARKKDHDARVPVKASGMAVEASSPGKVEADAPFDHVALVRDLSQRCTVAQSELLEVASNADFDRIFMQAQVRAHARAIIMVDVFRSRASSDLRPALDKVRRMLRSHLEQATTLCKKCEAVAAATESQGKQR